MTEASKGAARSADKALRANVYPNEGFSMVVDGKFKQHFASLDDAQKAAIRLKIKFPMLQVAVRDAITAERTLINLPEQLFEQAG